MRWLWIAGCLVGCTRAVTPTLPQHATELPPQLVGDALVFEPPPEPATTDTIERYSPRDLVRPVTRLSREEVILLEGGWRRSEPATIDIAEIDFLSRCARDYVHAQPATARRVLVDALTHYVTTCDAEGRVVLERPIGFDSGDRKTRSDVVLVGVIGPRGAGTYLRVSSCGGDATYDRVTLIADGESWTTSRLEVRRDPYGCEVAEMPYTRQLGKMLRRAVEDTSEGGSLVRFDGAGIELVFSEPTRDEIRSVLEAIDAVTVP